MYSTILRANLTRVISPPNSTTRRFPSYLLLTLLLYLLFIFYLPRCTLPDFPSVSSLTSLPFLSCCHQTTIVEKTSFTINVIDNSTEYSDYKKVFGFSKYSYFQNIQIFKIFGWTKYSDFQNMVCLPHELSI